MDKPGGGATRPQIPGSLPGKNELLKGRPRQFSEVSQFSLKLEADLFRKIKERAAREGVTFASLCREMLIKGLNEGQP